MTLYELLEITEGTFDTYDTVFDIVVTVDWIDGEEDYYDKFCRGIQKLVTVEKKVGNGLLINWTGLIENNIEVFTDFAKKNWTNMYEDDEDEFTYQWIREIHYWMAGDTSEPVYEDFVKNYMPLLN